MDIFGTPNPDEINPRLIAAAADGDIGRYHLFVYLGGDTVCDNGEALKRAAQGDHAEIVKEILYPGVHIQSGFPGATTLRGVDRLENAAEIAMRTAVDAGHKSSKVVTAVIHELDHSRGMSEFAEYRNRVGNLIKQFEDYRFAEDIDEPYFRGGMRRLLRGNIAERRQMQLVGWYPASGMNANLAITYSEILFVKNLGLEQTFLDHANVIYGHEFDKAFEGRGDLHKDFSRWVRAAVNGAAAKADIFRDEYVTGLQRYLQQHGSGEVQQELRRTLTNLDGEIAMHKGIRLAPSQRPHLDRD